MVDADCSGSFGCTSPKEAPPRAGHCSVPALSCRGLPAVARVAHVLVRASRRGGGNAGRVSGFRPEGRKDFHRCNGGGHRPFHSATLTSGLPYCGWHRSCVGRPARAGETRCVSLSCPAQNPLSAGLSLQPSRRKSIVAAISVRPPCERRHHRTSQRYCCRARHAGRSGTRAGSWQTGHRPE